MFSLLSNILPSIAIGFVLVVTLAVLVWFSLKAYRLWWHYRLDVIYLEVTPPAWTDRMPEATSQLFTALHGLASVKKWSDHLLKREHSFALEIVSTRAEGIRYVIRVAENLASGIEQVITSYLPEAKVKRTQGYFQSDISNARVINFKQSKHFAFPLKQFEFLSQQDPIGYITSAMTKLKDHELISLQLVITPTTNHEAEQLGFDILSNQDLLGKLDNRRAPKKNKIFHAINAVLFGIMDGIGDMYHGKSQFTYYGAEHYSHQRELENSKQVANRMKPARQLSYFEQGLVDTMHHKLSQPLFKTEIRVLVDCETKQEAKQRRRSFVSALNLLTVPKYQQLKAERAKYGWLRKWQLFSFTYRLPRPFHASNLLAGSELASLYHFPHAETAKTENVIKSLSKTLPASVSLKNGTKLDVLLGANLHHGSVTPIGLTEVERERHLYVIGGTGNGKTTMLLSGIVQDIHNGKGVAVIDPHGDLAETILEQIPKSRIDDVIYLDPDDLQRPIGINLLEITPNTRGDDLLREKDLVTEATISVLRKIFSTDDSGGHRVEYVLRNTIQTALTLEGASLFTIFRLLNDAKYRRNIVKTLQDEDLKNFWNNELGKAGEMQKVKMAAGITAKIGRFLFSASAKRMLEQERSTINFDEILDEGKILICNFSKGVLGEDTSNLFGTTVLAKLQIAALRRAKKKQADRRAFYLYVDEFQNFATMSFVQMLSEARKYKLFLSMAQQSTSQQDEQRLVDIILANVGTVVCFRSGSPADERYILPLFSPYIQQGEIANLPAYNFYVRIAALQTHEPMSGETVLLDDAGSERIAQEVLEHSRMTYGRLFQPSKPEEAKSQTPPEPVTAKRKPSDTKPSLNVKQVIPET